MGGRRSSRGEDASGSLRVDEWAQSQAKGLHRCCFESGLRLAEGRGWAEERDPPSPERTFLDFVPHTLLPFSLSQQHRNIPSTLAFPSQPLAPIRRSDLTSSRLSSTTDSTTPRRFPHKVGGVGSVAERADGTAMRLTWRCGERRQLMIDEPEACTPLGAQLRASCLREACSLAM